MMDNSVFSLLAIVKDGELMLSDPQQESVKSFFKIHDGETMQFILKTPENIRSMKQHRYYHGEFVKRCADHDGYTHNEMHEILKWEFGEHLVLPRNGKVIEVPKSTTKFTRKEFTEYLDKIAAFYGSEYAMRFMTPQEWYESHLHEFEIPSFK